MNILDQRDGRWTSVFDHAGIGTEIDRVMISELGSSGKINIIVGYTILNQAEKTAKFYSYSEGFLNVLYQDNYSVMNILDIDSDNAKELVLITHDTVERTGTAKLLKLEEKGFVLKSKTAMDGNGSDYKGVKEGKISDGTPALFLDSAIGDGSFETQILYYSDGQLRNPLEKTREVLAMTFRPEGYFSRDIDKDGVVEIPYVYPMPGYDLAEPDKQLFLTEWRSYEKFNLERKSVGYYSLTDGYCFMLPGRWQGSVTVVEDIAGGDIVFCKYNGSLASDMPELMRISVMEKGTNEAKLQNGYQTFFSKGQYDYMVKIPEDKSEPLILTQSEIMFNFIVL